MNQDGHFELYVQIILQGLKAIRKISFKKINQVNELIIKLESRKDNNVDFIGKEVYGRIKPSNYLLLFLIALGGKNFKLYTSIIIVIQKLFSNCFIAANQQLVGALQFMKDQYKEFLLLPLQDYSKKIFQEIYLETLVALPDKNQQINLLICKNMSLIFRLSQNNFSLNSISIMCDFLVDTVLLNRNDQFDKILKSTFLEIVRHAIQSLKEAGDRKLLEDDEEISIRQVCQRYGAVLADEVAIRLSIEKKYKISNYEIIPQKNPEDGLKEFKVLQFDEVNEKGQKNGKFGWCAVCRKPAKFYCRIQRIPVCSYQCKHLNYFQTKQLQKIYYEQIKSVTIYSSHLQTFCKIFSKYLSHQDIRKRANFADIFIYLSSQLRKIPIKNISLSIISSLQDIFHQCCLNIVLQTEAFNGCAVAIKKLIPLDIFTPQVQILMHQISLKIVHFLTPSSTRQKIIQFIKDLIKTQTFFQIYMNIDCKKGYKDVAQELINAISKLFVGITPPEGVTNLPPVDQQTRKLCYETLIFLQKSIRSLNKVLTESQCIKLQKIKIQKNKFKEGIKRFNDSKKPTKVIKQLIQQKYFINDPKIISQWLHKNIKKLNLVNVGQIIGDYDELSIKIRDQFFHQFKFKGILIDEALRILFLHFTPPGQSQIVSRILQSFSIQYCNQNQNQHIFKHSEAVYKFTYLLFMLQTSLHNSKVQQKMTLSEFSGLTKNMNGDDAQLSYNFLQQIYTSVSKNSLGEHSKSKQTEVINACIKGDFKQAQQIHNKHVYKHFKKSYQHLKIQPKQYFKQDKYHLKLLTTQLFGQVILAISVKIRESQQRDQVIKNIQLIQEMIKFSLSLNIQQFVPFSIKNIWEQLSKTMTLKKYILIQKMFIWVRQFTPHVYDQWSTIIHSFSMFYRTKAIKKDNNNKNYIMAIIQDKCYLYDNYIESVLSKSNKFNNMNLLYLIDALIQCSRQEISDNNQQLTFCLQKIGDLFQWNNSRLVDIVPLTWSKLKQYYIQLGRHKTQKVALFGTDFLKQLLTKFIKKKDLQFFQKQYMKPFEDIFNSNISLGVKQYIVGGLSYFVNNYFPNIKDGWKIILNIVYDSFEEDEHQIVKQKSHLIVKKIYQTNFSIIDLDQNYKDYVQILSRMAREKDQLYIKSCIQAIKAIVVFYQSKLQINVQDQNASENSKFDMTFWQTMWLPLLNTIYGICGDFRPEIQNESIELLFYILMRYGKLFKYQFWKMIMQGILRPTFQQITYTSQSKPLKNKELQQWLSNSFSRLFSSINLLIQQYFKDFKQFLPDILKIYESCIISNSNKILTQLSTQALTELLNNVGDEFQDLNWRQYIQFVKTVLKKSIPNEIQSLQMWTKSKQIPGQTLYQGKILTLNLILINCQCVIEKFGAKLKQDSLLQFREIIDQTYKFCHKFNKNIELRSSLWKNGFFQDMKSLPGLVKQEHEALKGKTLTAFKLIQKSEIYIDEFAQHSLKILQDFRKSLILSPPTSISIDFQQKQREGTMLQVLILENIMPNLQQIGLLKLVQLGYKQTLFKHILDISTQRTFCSKCNFCEFCQTNGERQAKILEVMRDWLQKLFSIQNKPN